MLAVRARFICTFLMLAAFAGHVHGQTSYPMVMSISPVAAQAGKSSEHTFNSRYSMYGAYEVLISGSGVTGEVLHPAPKPEDAEKKPELTKMKVRFTVAPDAELGVRDVRIVTPTGVSTIGQLVIAKDPVVVEAAKNDTLADAQTVSLPATLCGAIEKAEDIDFYKFHVEAGQAISFHVRSARLQDKIHDLQTHADPILKLRNASGVTLASADNDFFADPLLSYKFEQAGDYVLEIRDVRYEGNVNWEYSIEATDRPFIENVFPLAVAPGQPTQMQLIGSHLPSTAVATCTAPMDAPMGAQWVRLPMGAEATNPVPVLVSDLPLVAEADADNNTTALAQTITVPVGVNGRIEKESDVDYYAFEAKKGELFNFEIVARRRQSSLDSNLRIVNEKGAQVGVNDDMKVGRRTNADSALEGWTAPADGKFFVEIRDVHLRGGERFPYFLKVTKALPSFELYLDTDKTQISPGGNAVMYVRVERKCGFTGPVDLHIDGLPMSVSATCGRILDGKNVDGIIVLEADHDAPLTAANVQVTGTAVHKLADGTELSLSAVAAPYQETYMPGGGRSHWPVDSHTVAITNYGDVRGVFLSDYDITLKPGEAKKIEVTIDRNPEFKANVTLDMVYQHLSSNFGNSLPPGITLDDKQAKTLLAGGATQGFLTIKAAKDAAPVEKQQACVMAHVSLNFVMKATYASRPVFITIVKDEAAK